jgi:hypothetical protein
VVTVAVWSRGVGVVCKYNSELVDTLAGLIQNKTELATPVSRYTDSNLTHIDTTHTYTRKEIERGARGWVGGED